MLSNFAHSHREVILCLGIRLHSHPVVTQHTSTGCAVHILNSYKICPAINLQSSTPKLATCSYFKCTVKQLNPQFNIKKHSHVSSHAQRVTWPRLSSNLKDIHDKDIRAEIWLSSRKNKRAIMWMDSVHVVSFLKKRQTLLLINIIRDWCILTAVDVTAVIHALSTATQSQVPRKHQSVFSDLVLKLKIIYFN